MLWQAFFRIFRYNKKEIKVMNLVKKIKTNLLTKLFVEWVKEEKDIEALQITNKMISDRLDVVDNRTHVIGFRR